MAEGSDSYIDAIEKTISSFSEMCMVLYVLLSILEKIFTL